mgnify:CR=1 FL=1
MTVEQQVKQTIAEQFGISIDTVNVNDHLVKFNIDSLDIVEIVMDLEEKFNIQKVEVTQEEFYNLAAQTV